MSGLVASSPRERGAASPRPWAERARAHAPRLRGGRCLDERHARLQAQAAHLAAGGGDHAAASPAFPRRPPDCLPASGRAADARRRERLPARELRRHPHEPDVMTDRPFRRQVTARPKPDHHGPRGGYCFARLSRAAPPRSTARATTARRLPTAPRRRPPPRASWPACPPGRCAPRLGRGGAQR